MNLNVMLLTDTAKVPTYAIEGSACFDIYADSDGAVSRNAPLIVSTGLAFEIPEGYCVEIYSRSGQGFNNDVRLSNCVGQIDAGYLGEIKVKLAIDNGGIYRVEKGDRIAQGKLVPVLTAEFTVVEGLKQTARGSGGFGSTGA